MRNRSLGRPSSRPASSRPATSYFRKFVRQLPAHPESLPYTHVTDAHGLREISASKLIQTNMCDILGASLVYCFYGRPAYRKNQGEQASGLTSVTPVALILNPERMPEPRFIHPFDTGAFNAKLFRKHLHPAMTIQDFGLDPDLSMPGKLVAHFLATMLCIIIILHVVI